MQKRKRPPLIVTPHMTSRATRPATSKANSAGQPGGSSDEEPLLEWCLRPRQLAPEEEASLPPIRKTHSRPVPLPLYATIQMKDVFLKGNYAGHGLSKMVYELIASTPGSHYALRSSTLLKLTPAWDPEPITFGMLRPELCPTIYEYKKCQVHKNSAGQPETWNAWTTEKALPCDRALERDGVNLQGLVWHTLLCICLCGKGGLFIDDTGLFNFGVLNGRAVLIDAGSRECATESLPKSSITPSLKKFWQKIHWCLKEPEHKQIKANVRTHFLHNF